MLSIIIPIYNSVVYIDKVIDSVLKQTFKEWELILIDDGSTDGSDKICDYYSSLDNRIKSIHQENAGVSSARNVGLDKARGTYVMFIDSDDYILNDYCENLVKNAINSDIVISGYTQLNKDKKNYIFMNNMNVSLSSIDSIFDELYTKHLMNAPWAKIYKRSIIGNQRFDANVMLGEDLLFNLEYLSKCSMIKIVDFKGYMYNCMNINAATKKFRDSDCKQIIELYNTTKKFQRTYCLNSKSSYNVEKDFFITGLYLIQSIYYSDKTLSKKKKLLNELLDDKDFLHCCNIDYHLSVIQTIPQYLIRCKSKFLLTVFYKIKEAVYNLRSFIFNRKEG